MTASEGATRAWLTTPIDFDAVREREERISPSLALFSEGLDTARDSEVHLTGYLTV